MGVKKAARAALILVPLFGLQHILIPFRPEAHQAYEHLYEYVTVVVVSLQVRINMNVTCVGVRRYSKIAESSIIDPGVNHY